MKKRFNKIIEDIMKSDGLNYSNIGKRLGVSYQTVQNWIETDSVPKVETVIKLCEWKNISADWLLLGKEQYSSKDPLLDEALKKYKYLEEIKRRVELALKRGLSEEVLYENIKFEMDTALRELKDLKKETGCTPQGYSVG